MARVSFAGFASRKARPRHAESSLQIQIVSFFDEHGPPKGTAYLFAVPNGARRDKRTGGILKAEGVRAGVADLVLLLPGARTVFIEVKLDEVRLGDVVVQQKTRQRANQRDAQAAVEALGFTYRVVRSLEDFLALLDELGVPVRARPALSFRSR